MCPARHEQHRAINKHTHHISLLVHFNLYQFNNLESSGYGCYQFKAICFIHLQFVAFIFDANINFGAYQSSCKQARTYV